MIAYNYDPVTHEYIGRETAQENPKHPGEYLISAHSTLTEPPAIREGYARVWNEEEWSYVEDHRGATIWRDHFTSRTVEELGPIPEGWSIERPEKVMTRQDIQEIVYQGKCTKAYAGITVRQYGMDCTFATDTDSIAMCNAALISFRSDEDTIDWKVWVNNSPVIVTLTAFKFREVFAAGMQMIRQAFAIEALLNAEYADMSDEQISALTESGVKAHVRDMFDKYVNPVNVQAGA